MGKSVGKSRQNDYFGDESGHEKNMYNNKKTKREFVEKRKMKLRSREEDVYGFEVYPYRRK